MHQIMRFLTVLAILCGQAGWSGTLAFQSTAPPQSRDDNRLKMSDFTVDYPKKDWQLLVGAGSSLVVLARKNGEATVAVERTKVKFPLAPNEITDQTATLEAEDWLARRPQSSGFAHQMMDSVGARIIVIDFTQPGPKGVERVRMYTMPRGSDWFRVVCTTTQASFDKYKDVCHRIALSLTPTPSQ